MALTPLDDTRQSWDTDKIIPFDIESADWTEPVALGWLDKHDEFQTVHTGNSENPIKEFVDDVVLARKNRGMRFVAHNGGNFDFGFLVPYLIDNDDVQLQMLERGSGQIFFIKITEVYEQPCSDHDEVESGCDDCNTVKHNTYLQDSAALLPRGLDYLTEAYADTENEEFTDEEYDRIHPDWYSMDEDFRQKLLSYLRNDCVTLMEILQNFTSVVNSLAKDDDSDIGCSLTMGSTTMQMYRHQYMHDDETQHIAQPDEELEEIFRGSYYAGRTEVFRMTAEQDEYPLHHYDINSLFPHVYTNKPMPTGKPTVYKDITTEQGREFLDNDKYGGAVKITGTVPSDCKYPVLPKRVDTEDGNAEKVVFATGQISGWYMMREVTYAEEVGALENVEIEEMAVCQQTDQFHEYGNHLYSLKQSIDKEENLGKYATVKLLLNSFYGKFAMTREQTEIRQVDSLQQLDEDDVDWKPVGNNEIQMMNKGVVGVESESDANYIIPRIASAITASARIEMHKWFTRVRDAGGKIYYCDTDSVACDLRLEDIEPEEGAWVNEELGGMDKENEIKEAYFLRPKTYAELPTENGEELDGLVLKGKGMADLEDSVDFEDYREAFQHNKPELIGSSWEGVRGLATTLKEDWQAGVQTSNYDRALSGFDDKRIHNEDGTDSEPLNLNNLL